MVSSHWPTVAELRERYFFKLAEAREAIAGLRPDDADGKLFFCHRETRAWYVRAADADRAHLIASMVFGDDCVEELWEIKPDVDPDLLDIVDRHYGDDAGFGSCSVAHTILSEIAVLRHAGKINGSEWTPTVLTYGDAWEFADDLGDDFRPFLEMIQARDRRSASSNGKSAKRQRAMQAV